MFDVDALLLGAIAAVTLFLAALGIVAGLRRVLRPRGDPPAMDWRGRRRDLANSR